MGTVSGKDPSKPLNPNASALAIAPFTRNAGRASALLGFVQALGPGVVISTAIGAASPTDRLPIGAVFGVTAAVGLTILLACRKRAEGSPVAEAAAPVPEADWEDTSGEVDAVEAGCC